LEPETTNIRVIDPTTHPCPSHVCPPPCALAPPPMPPLQRTTATHPPLQRTHRRHHRRHQAPLPLRRTCCHVAPTPSPLLRNRTPTLAYKTPHHQLPQLPSGSKQSTLQINPLCQIASNSIFHSLTPKITMLGDSWVEDCCTWFIVFGFLLCMMVILIDRILQWEEQREIKRQ
jgi:hypothetical protein